MHNIYFLWNTLLLIIGFYLVLESFWVGTKLDRGGRVCQFTKYGSSVIVGFLTSYYAFLYLFHHTWQDTVPWQYSISTISIATGMWPNTFYRIFKQANRRI